MAQLFDKTDRISIFQYSRNLLGHCLRDYACEEEILNLPAKDKGKLGKLVEYLFFKYPPNSNAEADFAEAEMELKCTGLKNGEKEQYLIKERLVCNMINYCEVVNEDFEESHFYRKCLVMLILFYLYKKGVDNIDFQFLFAVLWKLPEKDLLIIRNDYETIINKIKAGQAHLLSEGDTVYLGACRKGQKSDGLKVQPFSSIGAKGRAFSLKPSYMRTVLRFVEESGKNAACNFEDIHFGDEIVTLEELKCQSFENLLIERFSGFYGKNSFQIAEQLSLKCSFSKDKYFYSSNQIVGKGSMSNVNVSEEFLKSGIMMKTIRVERNGDIKESMSFENIDYDEVYECDEWEDSRLYELYTNRFMFVVYRNTGEPIQEQVYLDYLYGKNAENRLKGKRLLKHEQSYVLEDVFFWTMPTEDIDIARMYWEDIRKQVLADNIRVGSFWNLKDDRKFHVRPKSQLSADKHVSPITGKKNADKLCYWFNKSYVREIIKKRKENEI